MKKLMHGAALAALISAPALAQDAPAGEIIVTGTRAKDRTVFDSPVPVDVLSDEALERSGGIGGDLGSALQTLAPSFNVQRQSQSGPADHIRAAQLRGMSPDQTLVLVNGKRRHVTAVVNLESKLGRGTNPVDLNSIPVNAIKRVEVLRDGAGAQYGSDAIAGVLNIILDDRPEALEASVNYGWHSTKFDPTEEKLNDGETYTIEASAGVPVGEGFLRFGAEYTNRNPTVRGGLGLIFGDEFGGFPAAATPRNLALLDQVNYKPGDGAVESLSGWFNTELPVGDAARFYSFGTINDRDTTGVGFFRFPDSDDNVLALFPNGFLPTSTGQTLDFALTVGVKGEIGGFDVDGSVGYGRNRFDFGLRNSVNPSLGAASPTRFFLGRYVFNQWSVNLDASRQFGSILAAFGGEYRREGFKTGAGDVASLGAVAYRGLRVSDEADVNRDVLAAYADLSGSVGAFYWDLAGRFEHYSDFGSRVSGKLAGRYEIMPSLAIRGAVSNSFRAPALAQGSFRQSVTTFAAGSNVPQLVGTVPVNDPIARSLGARDLKAEKSMNFSIGVAAQPTDALSFTVDFFHIDVDDRIALSENIAGPNGTIINFFTNAVDTRTWGLELVGTYKRQVGAGDLNISAAYSLARNSVRKLNVPEAQFNVEEINTLTNASPRNKSIVTASWSNERFSWLARVTRYGGVTRVFAFFPEGANTYGREYQVDVEFAFRPVEPLELSAGASNLLDAYPDRQDDNYNFAGNFPYDPISPLGINGRYLYAKAKVSF